MNEPVLNQPQPQKSRKFLKWALLGCGGLILLVVALFGIGAYFINESLSSDSAKAESIAQEILQFEKPPGYKGCWSMAMFGVKAAMLVSGSERGTDFSSITLASSPKGTQEESQKKKDAQDEAQRQLRAIIEKQME